MKTEKGPTMVARVRLQAIPIIHLLLLLSATSIEASTVRVNQLRFSEAFPAREFFDRCNISVYLSEYCSPVYNLGVRNVYVGCGSRAGHTEQQGQNLWSVLQEWFKKRALGRDNFLSRSCLAQQVHFLAQLFTEGE